MTQNTDLTDATHALAAQARLLSQSRRELRDHPEQVPGILKNLIETVHYLDDIVEVTEVAYRGHADTAVTALGNEAAGHSERDLRRRAPQGRLARSTRPPRSPDARSR